MRSLRTHWERTLGVVLVLLGVVLGVVGYAGVKGARYAVDEISFLISGGVGGILALMIGTMLLISGDRREQLTALDGLADALEADTASAPAPAVRTDARPKPTSVVGSQIKV